MQKNPHLLVIGDVMVDHYVRGHVDRISPEAPVPVLRIAEEWRSPGGAANVAENLLALGARVTLLGRVGDDEDAGFLRSWFSNRATIALVPFAKYRTERKSRYMAGPQQLIRVDHATLCEQPDRVARQVLHNEVERVLELPHDGVVCSDYGKGCFDHGLTALLRGGKQRCFLDCKPKDLSTWQAPGEVSPLTLKPNQQEYEAMGGRFDPNGSLHGPFPFARALEADELLVTRGSDGMDLLYNDLNCQRHFNGSAQEVFSVVGAGDTALATYAWARAGNLEPVLSAAAANLAAAESVRHTGTVAIEQEQVLAALLRYTEEPDEADLQKDVRADPTP